MLNSDSSAESDEHPSTIKVTSMAMWPLAGESQVILQVHSMEHLNRFEDASTGEVVLQQVVHTILNKITAHNEALQMTFWNLSIRGAVFQLSDNSISALVDALSPSNHWPSNAPGQGLALNLRFILLTRGRHQMRPLALFNCPRRKASLISRGQFLMP
jgi:hypothetical protein